MTTHRQIRGALANMLRSIPGIGQVQEYERFAKREHEYRAFYEYTPESGVPQVRGWFIRRVSPADVGGASFCATRHDRWEVRGFMSLDDAGESELSFDDLVDAIIALFFDNDPVIPGLRIEDSDTGQRARLVSSQPVMLAGVLCHSATITLQTIGS